MREPGLNVICRTDIRADPPKEAARHCGIPRDRSWAERWKRKLIYTSLRMTVRLLRRGHDLAALRILEQVVEFAPEMLVARIWLARLAISLNDEHLALNVIRADVVDIQPGASRHYCRIAAIYLALEDLAAAERYLNLAKEEIPRSPTVWMLLGQMHRMRGHADDAMKAFLQCSEVERTGSLKVDAIKNAARSLADVGRRDVESLYQRILEIAPKDAFACYGIVDCRTQIDLHDPVVQRIRQLIEDTTIPIGNKSHLHYALGVVYDRCGNPGSAIAHMTIANRLRSQSKAAFDSALKKNDADARCTVFTSELVNELSRYGCQEDVLICVVGMPRSGTTLTEQILGAHSDIAPLGERNDFWRLSRSLPKLLGTNKRYPECCADLTRDDIECTWRTILDRMRRTAGPCLRMVTKLPEDFFELGMIKILFPRAKIVNTQRNPLDVCLSCFQQNFKNIPYSRDLDALASAYHVYQQMMRHWRNVLPKGSIFDLSYEQLVAKPESIVPELCGFLGVAFQDSCLRFYSGKQSVRTMSRWQVKQEIYQTSVNRSDAYREFLGPLLGLKNDVAEV